MQSERHYKVDKYLEMARITRSEFKKDHFLEMAETYLEMEDASYQTVAQNTDSWLSELSKEYFVGMSISDMYDKYLSHAKETGESIETRYIINRRIRETFNMNVKRMRVKDSELTKESVYY